MMDLESIVALQSDFDKKHGWSFNSNNHSELIDWLHKDLVGLFGELGEFANLLKKTTIIRDKPDLDKSQKLFEELKNNFSEELIDSFIYLIRIATHLGVDLEKEYLKKLEVNRSKYQKYER
jgi:NTP pyrophosphatase (non-canonical NTP hydrolase)